MPTTEPLSRLVTFSDDLGLGELDLLADEQRDALRDVEDDLGDRAVLARRGGEVRRAAALTRADPP